MPKRERNDGTGRICEAHRAAAGKGQQSAGKTLQCFFQENLYVFFRNLIISYYPPKIYKCGLNKYFI